PAAATGERARRRTRLLSAREPVVRSTGQSAAPPLPRRRCSCALNCSMSRIIFSRPGFVGSSLRAASAYVAALSTSPASKNCCARRKYRFASRRAATSASRSEGVGGESGGAVPAPALLSRGPAIGGFAGLPRPLVVVEAA